MKPEPKFKKGDVVLYYRERIKRILTEILTAPYCDDGEWRYDTPEDPYLNEQDLTLVCAAENREDRKLRK